MALRLNDAEEAFICQAGPTGGFAHLQRLFYMALLSRMHYATRLVGADSWISWRTLGNALYVNPGPGIGNSGAPSKNQLRKAARALERAGWLKIVSDRDEWRLIFLMLKADGDQSVQKQKDREPDREKDSGNRPGSHAQRGVSKQVDREVDREKDTRPKTNPISLTTTTSYREKRARTDEEVVVVAEEKDQGQNHPVFPRGLSSIEQEAMRRELAGIEDPKAQEIVDQMAAKKAKNEITSTPLGFLKHLVKQYKAGSFVPDLAHEVALKREREAAPAAAAPAPATRSAPTPEYLAEVAKLKKTR